MVRMIFEFQTAQDAMDFRNMVDLGTCGRASVSHRVVDVETTETEEARALAAQMHGREETFR